MQDEPQKIFEYLPIRNNPLENKYLNHLWSVFSTLEQSDEISRPFAIMPFHLLFMMALQYKVLRIYKEHKDKYDLAIVIKNPRDEEKDLLAPESPLAVAFLGESEIVDFLRIAGLSIEDSRNIKKSIIRYRNSKIAHAKGHIEPNLDNKIIEYFQWLEVIQNAYLPMNCLVVDSWIAEIEKGDNIESFLEKHFLDSCFSPRDYGDVIKKLLDSKKISFEQWQQVINKGIEVSYDQTILVLRSIIVKKSKNRKISKAIQILRENGEIVD
jgi:hypothetical protein